MKKRYIIAIVVLLGLSICLFIGSIAVFFYFYSISRVPTSSMSNTILQNEQILSEKHFKDIKRGDIFIFKFPKDRSVQYAKRIVGLPGEKIEIKDQQVYINGHALPEQIILARPRLHSNNQFDFETPMDLIGKVNDLKNPAYIVYISTAEQEDITDLTASGQKYGVGEPYLIPENSYFMLGDYRDNSQDSRYWGPVTKEDLVSKVIMVRKNATGSWEEIK